jgi:hypothetical protein
MGKLFNKILNLLNYCIISFASSNSHPFHLHSFSLILLFPPVFMLPDWRILSFVPWSLITFCPQLHQFQDRISLQILLLIFFSPFIPISPRFYPFTCFLIASITCSCLSYVLITVTLSWSHWSHLVITKFRVQNQGFSSGGKQYCIFR